MRRIWLRRCGRGRFVPGGRAGLVALFLALSAGAWAQGVVPGPFGMFTISRYYNDLVGAGVNRLPTSVFPRCPKLAVGASQIEIVEPVAMGPKGVPVSGLWKQTFPVSGCGNDTTLNLFFRAGANGLIETLPGVPGGTHADLRLQADARPIAVTAAGLTVMGCGRFDVLDSRFDGFDGEAAEGGKRAWTETWSLGGCDRVVLVGLAFQPEGTGMRVVQRGGVRDR